MELRLHPVNALIGLVTRGDVNPPALADGGFLLVGLEVPIVGDGGTVKVDVILLHEPSAHLLLCEVKSGANAHSDQAIRYAAADPHAVVIAGHVTLPRRVAPTTEVVYVCVAEHVSRIQKGFQAVGVRFPILAIHADKISLESVVDTSEQLSAPFAGGPILLQGPPTRFIPFDHDSSPHYDRRPHRTRRSVLWSIWAEGPEPATQARGRRRTRGRQDPSSDVLI